MELKNALFYCGQCDALVKNRYPAWCNLYKCDIHGRHGDYMACSACVEHEANPPAEGPDYSNAPADDPVWDEEDARSIINNLHLFLLARKEGRKALEATTLEDGFLKYQSLIDRACVERNEK